MELSAELYKAEMAAALKSFDLHIVSLEKSPEECRASLESLVTKAIKIYETRPEGLRHGLALDNQITVMISQAERGAPIIGIYFNLHSPYSPHQKLVASKTPKTQKTPKTPKG